MPSGYGGRYGFHPQPNLRTMGTKELSLRLGIHYLTVLKYCKNGQIKSVRYGKLYRITLEEVDRIEKEGIRPLPKESPGESPSAEGPEAGFLELPEK